MEITLGQIHCGFQRWKPELGQVFQNGYAFDSETTLVDEQRDWISPAFVLGAACDGQRGFFITREHLAAFFRAHRDVLVAMHNAPFDLAVIHTVDRDLDIYSWIDRDLVWDTQLLHRLLVLGTDGHTAGGKGQSTLEVCVAKYLNIELPKDVKDSAGDVVRISYNKWLNRRPQEIEQVYLEYLGKDVIANQMLAAELFRRLHRLLIASYPVWGYVSYEWMNSQIRQWGYQTHHIQLKGAIVLREIKANGLEVDVAQRDRLVNQLEEVANEYRAVLRASGYLPGQKGCKKALQEIIAGIARRPDVAAWPKTDAGKFSTKREVMEEFRSEDSFIGAYLFFNEVEKLKSTFLSKMGRCRLHPSFQPLLVTGRTSSFGEINAQNLPRDDRVRSCFVPSRGKVFINADYASIEMVTLSQAVQSQFRQVSAMAVALNNGQDLHKLVASRVTGKSPENVTSDERSKAKPINFGKPGGMGDAGLQRYAKGSYGVELSENEVRDLTDSWFELFPEMRSFLHDDGNLGGDIAEFFELRHGERPDCSRFGDGDDHRSGGSLFSSIDGWMLRKVLHDPEPRSNSGTPYSVETIEYFWDKIESKSHFLSSKAQTSIRDRQPSWKLASEVQKLVNVQGCLTLTGRLRAKAGYCARHNTVFQGLAADGAKLALWRLWRAGYRIVNFIHDEVLVEVPEEADLRQHAESIRGHMIAGMREVVPDVAVDVKYAASRRWYKQAEMVIDGDGRLGLWEPAIEHECCPAGSSAPVC